MNSINLDTIDTNRTRPNTTLQTNERNIATMELSKRYLAKAEENVRQAESTRRQTSRARTVFLPVLLLVLAVLASWTASVFVGIGASWWAALPISLVLHGGLAFAIHRAFHAWGRGERGQALLAGAGAALLLLAFVGLACFRAYRSIEEGNDVAMSVLMAAVYAILETVLPIGLGAEYARRCEQDHIAHEELHEFKQLANDIREDMEDAQGIWQDKEAKIEHEITELRHQDTGTAQERIKIDLLVKRLRRLHESHPGQRFHDLAGTKPLRSLPRTEAAGTPLQEEETAWNRTQNNEHGSLGSLNSREESLRY